jgi:protein-S-isoprenylcysteine O-methyltransferase Ste14
MKPLWLFLKNVVFTVFIPGFVAGWVPLRWFERRPQWPEEWRAPHYAGAIFVVLGVIIYLHCQWLFATRGQGTPAPIDPPKKLVRRGLYKWVRNPMYLAVFTVLVGETVFLRSGHIAVYFVCLVCAVHVFVLLVEEESLRRRFGAMYEDYRRDVPRWLPRKPKPPLETVAPFSH